MKMRNFIKLLFSFNKKNKKLTVRSIMGNPEISEYDHFFLKVLRENKIHHARSLLENTSFRPFKDVVWLLENEALKLLKNPDFQPNKNKDIYSIITSKNNYNSKDRAELLKLIGDFNLYTPRMLDLLCSEKSSSKKEPAFVVSQSKIFNSNNKDGAYLYKNSDLSLMLGKYVTANKKNLTLNGYIYHDNCEKFTLSEDKITLNNLCKIFQNPHLSKQLLYPTFSVDEPYSKVDSLSSYVNNEKPVLVNPTIEKLKKEFKELNDPKFYSPLIINFLNNNDKSVFYEMAAYLDFIPNLIRNLVDSNKLSPKDIFNKAMSDGSLIYGDENNPSIALGALTFVLYNEELFHSVSSKDLKRMLKYKYMPSVFKEYFQDVVLIKKEQVKKNDGRNFSILDKSVKNSEIEETINKSLTVQNISGSIEKKEDEDELTLKMLLKKFKAENKNWETNDLFKEALETVNSNNYSKEIKDLLMKMNEKNKELESVNFSAEEKIFIDNILNNSIEMILTFEELREINVTVDETIILDPLNENMKELNALHEKKLYQQLKFLRIDKKKMF